MTREGQDRADALGWRRRPNRPKTFARYHTIPQKVTTVSICDKGTEPRTVGRVRELRPYERSRCAEHGRMGYARPTGGSHARTTRGPAQRIKGAKRRPRQRGCGHPARPGTV